MSRFTDQQSVTADGQDLTFKTRPGADMAAVSAVPGLLAKAKSALQKTGAELGAQQMSDEVKKWAKVYFLTGSSGPSSSEIKLIRRVLTATLTGLTGDLTLKIGQLVGRNDKDVHGSVRQIPERLQSNPIIMWSRKWGPPSISGKNRRIM